MPMGNCDRMKKHISDYIEGTLDPTTRKEFEKNLEIFPELNTITKNISILSSILHKLPSQKCSDEFMVNLRERIHFGPKNVVATSMIKKYSYAVSFLVLIIISVLGVNSIFLQQDDSGGIQAPADYHIDVSEPPSQVPIKASSKISPSKDNLSNKSNDSQPAITDSLNTPIGVKENTQANQAKQTTKNVSMEK
jgi:cytoskeletal protein RodZ